MGVSKVRLAVGDMLSSQPSLGLFSFTLGPHKKVETLQDLISDGNGVEIQGGIDMAVMALHPGHQISPNDRVLRPCRHLLFVLLNTEEAILSFDYFIINTKIELR
jgi:hypothetical protein